MVATDEARAKQQLLDMQDQLSRDPYDALGLIPSATAADIRSAFLTKTKQFHPARFGRMAPDIQRLANEVFLALRATHDTIARPMKTGPAQRPSGPIPTLPQRPVPTGVGAPPQQRPLFGPSTGARPATVPGTAVAPGRPPARPGSPTGHPPTSPTPMGKPGGGAVGSGDREVAAILELIAQNQLAAAKVALETLVARNPQAAKNQALLCFVKGRMAQLDKRIDEARVELQDALQLDPDLQLAKTALAELFTRRR